MIVYVSTAAHQYTVRTLLETRPTSLDGVFIILSYDEFLSWVRLPVAHYVFTDLDRLPASLRRQVAERVVVLESSLPEGSRILNHPARCIGRLALLRSLEAAGINNFRGRRVTDGFDELTFPVFVRFENDHAGAQTPLIQSSAQLTQEIDLLRARGVALEECVVIEYIDVRNHAGLFEKFSVFRVGDVYFAAEHSVHSGWICKGNEGEFWSQEWGERELQFQVDNPHVALLKPVFELAGIEYGRVDYAFSNGRLQVFEINTNPMLDSAGTTEPLRQAAQARFIECYVAACCVLSGTRPEVGELKVSGRIGSDLVQGGSRLRSVVRYVLRATGMLRHECRMFRWLHRLRG